MYVNFINYRSLFKNDYGRGIRALEQILLDKTQAEIFTKNIAGVAVIFSFDKEDADGNANELYDLLTSSDYSNEAALTCLNQYVDFTSDTYIEELIELMQVNDEVFNAVMACYTVLSFILKSDNGWNLFANFDKALDYWSYNCKSKIIVKSLALACDLNPDDYKNMSDFSSSETAINALKNSKDLFYKINHSYQIWYSIANSEVAASLITSSEDIMSLAVEYPKPMELLSNSELAMKFIVSKESIMQLFANSNYAPIYGISQIAMSEIASSESAVTIVTSSKNYWDSILQSSIAMGEIAKTTMPLNIIMNNEEAFNSMLDSFIGMSEMVKYVQNCNILFATKDLIQKISDYENSLKAIRGNGIPNNVLCNSEFCTKPATRTNNGSGTSKVGGPGLFLQIYTASTGTSYYTVDSGKKTTLTSVVMTPVLKFISTLEYQVSWTTGGAYGAWYIKF